MVFALCQSPVNISHATPGLNELLASGISIEFVTEDDSKRVTVLGGEIRIDGTFYDVDKNILDELRETRVWSKDE